MHNVAHVNVYRLKCRWGCHAVGIFPIMSLLNVSLSFFFFVSFFKMEKRKHVFSMSLCSMNYNINRQKRQFNKRKMRKYLPHKLVFHFCMGDIAWKSITSFEPSDLVAPEKFTSPWQAVCKVWFTSVTRVCIICILSNFSLSLYLFHEEGRLDLVIKGSSLCLNWEE